MGQTPSIITASSEEISGWMRSGRCPAGEAEYLDRWTEKQAENAGMYNQMLADVSAESFRTPAALPGYRHIYNQYSIRTAKRDELKAYLKKTALPHENILPLPMHLQECFGYLSHGRRRPLRQKKHLRLHSRCLSILK